MPQTIPAARPTTPPSDTSLAEPLTSLTPRARWSIYLLLIALAGGQVLGKILAVNSVNVIDAEKQLRADFQNELKYLAVTAAEAGDADKQKLYATALEEEFRSKAEELADPKAAADIKAAKDKAPRKWPLTARRENWEKRGKQATEAELLATVRNEIRKQRPFLSGNDRSRWLTVRSLVELGTYEIDQLALQDTYWDSLDIVRHKNADGEDRFYSSKPPLMATIIAGEYWILHKLTGWTLGDHPFELGRIMLVTFNLLPLLVGWIVFAKIVEDWGTSDWGRIALVATVCFATMMSAFSAALTNHLWAFVTGILATYDASRIWRGSKNPLYFVGAGFWSMFLFTSELPAASFVAALFCLLAYVDLRRTLFFAAPAALLVAVAYFGTNYIAHGTWKPPYSFGAGDVSAEEATKNDPNNWYNYEYIREIDGAKRGYWKDPKSMNPVDLGEPSKWYYAFNGLLGHHGNFSLTPILLLVFPGVVLMIRARTLDMRLYGLLVAGVSVVCLYFYLWGLDQRQRNYGGPISAFRQLLWLHPLWLLAATPAFDWAARTTRRQLCVGVLLAWSMVSATYPTWNPWIQNWIWNLYELAGWPTMTQ